MLEGAESSNDQIDRPQSSLADYVLLALDTVDRPRVDLDVVFVLVEAVLVVVLVARDQVHVVDGYEHLRALYGDLVHLTRVGEQEEVQAEHRSPLSECRDHMDDVAPFVRLPSGSIFAVEYSNCIGTCCKAKGRFD